MNTMKSEALFARAKARIPGGVNSPVRGFSAVGGTPRFIARAKGQYMYDCDGNRYLDYIGSWGPMLFGQDREEIREAVMEAVQEGLSFGAATEREVLMAELMCEMVPGLEMVRMVNSGTEAVMSAVRAARGYTGRDKLIKFEGCYHGHGDMLLVKAGSGVMTEGMPGSLGVPAACVQDTLTAVYNDLESVRALFDANPGKIAALIVEPVAANMGVIPPAPGFLEGLREICTREGAVLIFDEVITGFRLSPGGAASYFGVCPDLFTFGKIIGGGMPVGAYGGRREIMHSVSPLGGVYQAGTLSGNPVAMAAGLAALTRIRRHPEIYRKIYELGTLLAEKIREEIARTGAPCQVNQAGSLLSLFFHPQPVRHYQEAGASDTAQFARYFHYLLDRGIYIGPSQFEAMFISEAHTEENIRDTAAVIGAYLEQAYGETS